MNTKTPLVLVPGLLCDRHLWQHQDETLSDIADVSIVDMTQDGTVGDMAARVLREAPPRFALAGLSMGGYVAHEVMRRAPERVTKLALVDTSARADTEEQLKRRRDLIDQVGLGKFKGVTKRLLPLLILPDRLSDDALVKTVQAMAEHVGKEAFLRQQNAIMTRPDSRGGLADIKCPTLVMCGRQDALTPLELHEEMAAAIADATLVIIEESGHLAPLEQPHAVSAVLRYWLQA